MTIQLPNADIQYLEEFNHEVGLLCNSRWIVSHLPVQLVVFGVLFFLWTFMGVQFKTINLLLTCIRNLHEFLFRTQVQQLVFDMVGCALNILDIFADCDCNALFNFDSAKFDSAALAAGSFPCSIQVVHAYALYPHSSRSGEQCTGDVCKFDTFRSAICINNELRHSETVHTNR